MRMRALAGFTFILMASVSGAAADEWRVEKLNGLVFFHHDAQWHRLELGDVVSDARVIRTLPSGSVEFVRDEEHIAIDGNSQVQIKDAERSRFTTVEQWYGKVTIQAEKQNVQHFSVETPFLAAVVKGTRFTVISRDGEARVVVEEGTVEVHDELYEVVTDVRAGQRADVAPGQMLEISGGGPKAPVISETTGNVITEAIRDAVEDGDVLPGELGQAIANVAKGVDPGRGLGSDNANGQGNSGNGHGNQTNGNSGNGHGSQNNGNSGNGIGVSIGGGNGNGGVGVNVGIGNGGSGKGGGIGVSVGLGNSRSNDHGNSGSGGGIGVDVNVGGGGVGINVGGNNANSGKGGGIDLGVDLGGGGIGLSIGGSNGKGRKDDDDDGGLLGGLLG